MITLKSGKQIWARMGLITIQKHQDGKFELYEGCDRFIPLFDNQEKPIYTKDDLIELAEMMINQWQEYRFAIANGDVPTIDLKS